MPRLWMYISDRLSPEGRELGEQLGSCVYSVYGAMEAGTIGFQCEVKNGFHTNIDLCVVGWRTMRAGRCLPEPRAMC